MCGGTVTQLLSARDVGVCLQYISYRAWLQATAAVTMRLSLFLDGPQRGQAVTDVSGQPIRSICKGQALHE